MSAIGNAPPVAQSWGITEFFSKIGEFVTKVWEAVKNFFFCCWGTVSSNPPNNPRFNMEEYMRPLTELRAKIDQYRLGRPLNDREKENLQQKKREVEAIFAEEERIWSQAEVRMRTPRFIQYRISGDKGDIERLLNGQPLEIPALLVMSAVEKIGELIVIVETYPFLGRHLTEGEIDDLKTKHEEMRRLINLARRLRPDLWNDVLSRSRNNADADAITAFVEAQVLRARQNNVH